MTNEEKDLELLVEQVNIFEEKRKRQISNIKILVSLCTFVMVILYLYLRLFNTEFYLVSDTETLVLKYSTAWFIRYPAEYEGKLVTTVEDLYAGERFGDRAPNTLYVYIEDGIKTIYRLNYSTTLRGVRLPDTIENIRYMTFEDDEKLRWVSLPKEAKNGLSIGQWAFKGTAVREIILPEGTTSIDNMAFVMCSKLKRIEIPDTTTYVGPNLFMGCFDLEYVDLPAGMEHIEGDFFYACDSLKEISYPESLRTISATAFEDSNFWGKEVSELELPDSVYFAYAGRDTLLNVDILNELYTEEPEGLTKLLDHVAEGYTIFIDDVRYPCPIPLKDFIESTGWELVEETPSDDKYAYFKLVKLRNPETEKVETFFLMENEIHYMMDR